jgi:hypothetical protein
VAAQCANSPNKENFSGSAQGGFGKIERKINLGESSMTRKHQAIYSDPTGAAAGASPVKRRVPRAKGSEITTSGISSSDGVDTATLGLILNRDAIARLAYSYWAARGYIGGSAEEDWLRAERELRENHAVSAFA